jgi:hypothetical protein
LLAAIVTVNVTESPGPKLAGSMASATSGAGPPAWQPSHPADSIPLGRAAADDAAKLSASATAAHFGQALESFGYMQLVMAPAKRRGGALAAHANASILNSSALQALLSVHSISRRPYVRIPPKKSSHAHGARTERAPVLHVRNRAFDFSVKFAPRACP